MVLLLQFTMGASSLPLTVAMAMIASVVASAITSRDDTRTNNQGIPEHENKPKRKQKKAFAEYTTLRFCTSTLQRGVPKGSI